MPKSKIEWTDYTLNPIKGMCPRACPYCYARRMYKRFKWNPSLRFEPQVMLDLARLPDNSRVFIGSTMELFHANIPSEWLKRIFGFIKEAYWIKSIMLTKEPHNLKPWNPLPCWIGVSVDGTDNAPLGRMLYTGFNNAKAKGKFISFEPLLAQTRLDPRDLEWAGIDWVIIGSQTQPEKVPPLKWVKEIIDAADKQGIPVFVKEPLATHYGISCKEFPKGMKDATTSAV